MFSVLIYFVDLFVVWVEQVQVSLQFYLMVIVFVCDECKMLEVFVDVFLQFVQVGLFCSGVVVGFGGGVVIDFVGFVVVSYLCGVVFYIVLIMLFGMVDVVVGGKIGVNFFEGKNFVGVFWLFCVVWCDMVMFIMLLDVVFCEGVVEVFKYGLMVDFSLFDWVVLFDFWFGGVLFEDILVDVIVVKVGVVICDLIEQGEWVFFNFGYMLVYVFEVVIYQVIFYGEVVVYGMYYVVCFSYVFGGVDLIVYICVFLCW